MAAAKSPTLRPHKIVKTFQDSWLYISQNPEVFKFGVGTVTIILLGLGATGTVVYVFASKKL